MPTIRQIAEQCGVSKPTVTERLKELDLWDSHVKKAGKAFEVDDYAAAAVADALKGKAAQKPPKDAGGVGDGATVRELLAAQRDLVRMHQDQLAAKDVQINALMGQVADLTRQVADLTRQVADSNAMIDRLANRSWLERLFGRGLPPATK